jgi:molybdopterin/thiamine biosynthesis adenylyltransferase
MRRTVWTSSEWRRLEQHFESAGKTEEGAFLLLRVGRSTHGARLLVQHVLLPPDGALERQGHHFLRPSGQWLSSVIGAAVEARCGLAFVHSHPDRHHPPVLSPIDRETSISWSRSITPMLDGPFASLVWSPKGVTGVMFASDAPDTPVSLDRAESLGDGTAEALHPVDRRFESEVRLDDRQVRALTVLGNTRLRDLEVGVVGAGGTGSPAAEQLVRMGAAGVVLVDPDVLDDSSNLRRVVGSRPSDVGTAAKKTEVVGRHLETLGLSTRVTTLAIDIRSEDAVRRLLDCDVVVNTTDTQSSRAFLNQVAYQYWLPVVDVGVRIGTTVSGAVSGMPVEVRVLLPDNGCLWCRKGVLDSETIYEENLPTREREKLAEEGYVQGLGQHQPSLAPLNYLASAIALLTMVRLYSGQALPAASTVFDAWEQYVHPLPAEVDPDCVCSAWRGKADDMPIVFLPNTPGADRP